MTRLKKLQKWRNSKVQKIKGEDKGIDLESNERNGQFQTGYEKNVYKTMGECYGITEKI